ncbi:MAG: hypothetical protein ACE5F4_02130 [Candidatus Paceibacteria bacterium]
MKVGIVIIIAVFVIGGAFLFLGQGPSSEVRENEQSDTEEFILNTPSSELPTEEGVQTEDTAEPPPAGAPAGTPTVVTVMYSSNGFSPSTVSVPQGGTVQFISEDGSAMWVASAQHPTHTVYAGTTLSEHCTTSANDAFDQCATGEVYEFTFDKSGTWNYHNHVRASHFGTVVVE